MSLVRRRIAEQRATASSLGHPRDQVTSYFWGGYPTASGQVVSEFTALNYSAVFCCVSLLATAISTMRLEVFKRVSRTESVPVDDHWANDLLNTEFNDEMDAETGRETMTGHLLTWGNCIAEKQMNSAGRTINLWPIRPDRVNVTRKNGGLLQYEVRRADLSIDVLGPDDVLHIPAMGFDGIVGYSPIRLAREAIGLGMGLEQTAAAFIGNGSAPGGILTSKKQLSEIARSRLRDTWQRVHQGASNSSKVAVLDEDLQWQRIGVPPNEAQMLESRKFQVDEIARWYRIPPHMVNSMDSATFSNIEEQGENLVRYCLRGWLHKWESRTARSLFSPAEIRSGLILRHDLLDLLKGDQASRYSAYNIGKNGGWLNTNKILAMEGMNPIGPQGDMYLAPLNMANAADLADGAAESQAGQVDPILKIVAQVQAKAITPEAAKVLIMVSFPLLKDADVAKILAGVEITPDSVPEAAATANGDEEPNEPAADTEPDSAEKASDEDTIKAAEVRAKATGVLREAMSRMIRKEVRAARTAASKPKEFNNWLDEFYEKHTQHIAESLRPCLDLLAVTEPLRERRTVPAFDSRDIAARYAAESRQKLLEVAGRASFDNFASEMESCVSTWEAERNPYLVEETV